MNYILHLLVVISLYSILAYSLDFLVGYLGALSVAQAAFFGLGAYAAALVGLGTGLSFPPILVIAMLVSASLCLLSSIPTARLRGDALIVSTLCVQILMSNIFVNWQTLTGGAQGLRNVPKAVVFGIELFDLPRFALLSGGLAVLFALVTTQLGRGSYGRLLRAIREDEAFVQSVGRRPAPAKAGAMAYSAALAGGAGALFATYYTYVSPSSFGLMESVLILSMVIIGGPGRPFGPLVGVSALVLLPEGLRFIGLPPTAAAHVRQLVYGVLLMLIVVAGAGSPIGRRIRKLSR